MAVLIRDLISSPMVITRSSTSSALRRCTFSFNSARGPGEHKRNGEWEMLAMCITSLPVRALAGLPHLSAVRLGGNRLTSLPP